ncbi:MAG: MATE family efflux transporter [Candidatus Gracilibacteria bacterium]|nr:MATE family efflux transporter [Candidatus Gracilibacteria bacterium]
MKLTQDHIPDLIWKIAVPASVGMFFQTMYNLVDTYFAGQISADALAGLSMSFAPFLLVISLGIGINQGANALISNALGAGSTRKASLYQVQAIGLAFLSSIALSFVGWQYSEEIFRIMGGEGEALSNGLEYISAIWKGAWVMVLVSVANSGLLAQGNTKINRNALVVGFFVNIGLDPLLMYGWGPIPAFGIAGIAWATIVIQFFVLLYILWKLIKSPLMKYFSKGDCRPNWKIAGEIAHQGFPASLNMMMVSVGIFIITSYVGRFGTEAIAAFGSAMRIEQIVLLPAIGLNFSALSITGQNFGAGFFKRIKEVYKISMAYGAGLMIPGGVLVYFASPYMMGIFTDNQEVIRIGVEYLRVDAFVLPAYIILFLSLSVLQGLKRPLYGVFVTLARQIAAPLSIFPITVGMMGLGMYGIWWGIAGIVWTAALVTVSYTMWAFSKDLK